jgi:hypothetical protein
MSEDKIFTEWDYVLKLTEYELHRVTIIHDNADSSGVNSANSAIIFTVELDDKFGGNGITYFGDSKLDCLKQAYADFKRHF